MKKINIFLIAVLLIFVTFNPAFAEKIELITTIPVETTLESFGTRQAAKVWIDMINRAKHSIDIAQFYLSSKEGELLEPVIRAILNAAERGVRIRLLIGQAVNKDMIKNTNAVLNILKNNPNIKATIFNWKKLNGSIIHAKYFILDKAEIFVGSHNFDWRALKHIHETGLLIKDKSMATALLSIFDADWKYSNGDLDIYKKIKTNSPVKGNKKMLLLSSPYKFNPSGVESALKILVKLIREAKTKIQIQLLNYKEKIYGNKKDFRILTDALINAANRGVQVRMLVSNWFSKGKGIKTLLNLNNIQNIEVKMVTIPESRDGFIPYARVIHSKVMRIDKKISWVGTSNWGYDYFFKSRNIEIVIENLKIGIILDKLFEQLWNSPYSKLMDSQTKYIVPRRK